MFDPELWNRLIDGSACPSCKGNREPEGDAPAMVADLASGRLLLQNDGDFPGYCILVLRRHATELYELVAAERGQFMEDIACAARAIAAVCRPHKMNYAILGNEVPHLHCHIIPRYPDDGFWGAPIWNRPVDQRRTLGPEEFERLRTAIRSALTTATP